MQLIIFIILSAWLVYNNAFDGVLFMDDYYHIVNHPKQLSTVMETLSDRLLLPGREFADATFALSNRFHGTVSKPSSRRTTHNTQVGTCSGGEVPKHPRPPTPILQT